MEEIVKTLEESWLLKDGDIVTSDGECVIEQSYTGKAPNEAERYQLAAAAPDMARVLIAIEWRYPYEHGGVCPACDCFNPDGDAPIGYAKGHEEDCPLDAALRKAGVR